MRYKRRQKSSAKSLPTPALPGSGSKGPGAALRPCISAGLASSAPASQRPQAAAKFSGPKTPQPRCRPWRASARRRPPPCCAVFVLTSFLRLFGSFDCIQFVLTACGLFYTPWRKLSSRARRLGAPHQLRRPGAALSPRPTQPAGHCRPVWSRV